VIYWPKGLDVEPQVPRYKPFKKATYTLPRRNGYFSQIPWPRSRSETRIMMFWCDPEGVIHAKNAAGSGWGGEHPCQRWIKPLCGIDRFGKSFHSSPGGKDAIRMCNFTTKLMRVTCWRCIKQIDLWAECPEMKLRRREANIRARHEARDKRRARAKQREATRTWHQLVIRWWLACLLTQGQPGSRRKTRRDRPSIALVTLLLTCI
jgi:hypothetical protein